MSKNFMQNGKWVDKIDAPKVVVCACGNKYIKTRIEQIVCLRCISQELRK